MRILIINPNSDQATETILRETAEKFVQKRFAVITPSAGIIPKKFALARKYHVEEQLKAVVVSKGNDKQSLLEAAEEALKYPNVSAIVLGCANYAGSDAYIEKKLNVPVYDGVIWALILAEGAVRTKLYQLENKE